MLAAVRFIHIKSKLVQPTLYTDVAVQKPEMQLIQLSIVIAGGGGHGEVAVGADQEELL